MTTTSQRHSLFDPECLYSRLRQEFLPLEKTYGLFLSLKYEQELAEEEQAERLVSLPPREAQSAAGLAPVPILSSHALPLCRTIAFELSAQSVTRLKDVKIEPSFAAETFHVSITCPRSLAGQGCRLLILEAVVREQLRVTVGCPEADADEQAIEKVLADAALRSNRELSRLLSAVPDVDGTLDGDGDCQFTVPVPADSPDLERETWLVLLIG